MMCAPFDLKDYLFGELSPAEKESVERHLMACAACHEEVVALNATRSTLLCVGDEEPVRRIAFVSDKVFEPRWWQKLLASGPQLGFASAAMLAFAIVFHAVQTPAAAPTPTTAPVAQVQLDQSAVNAEIARRVAVEVEKASAGIEARQTEKLRQVLAESDRRHQMDLQTVAEAWDRMNKRNGAIKSASFYPTGASIQ
jgi:anti-sigma factor RsiW